ncbi:MAG: hypothetical protein RI981_1023 [Bacteroidota bacterium]
MKSLLLFLLPFLALPQCPTITQQPQSQADCDGNSIRMIVGSNGTTFQWEKKRPQDVSFTAISGAIQANYQIMPTGNTANPTGTQYRVKVGIGNCFVYSTPASIQLRKINSILNPAICERGNGVLESVQTEGSMQFQWMRSVNGGAFIDLVDDDQFQGSQQNQLRITRASANLDGQKFKIRTDFTVSPNNDNEGSTSNQNQTATCPRTSSEITLQIKLSPIPRHAANSYSGCINQAFSVNASGCSPYTTQWYDSQRNPIGSGARLLVTHTDGNPRNYFAACNNAGCESPLSTGTQAQAFPKPAPPENAGTVAEICPGLRITFKASGGLTNIWYQNATSTSPLSTATTYSTTANPENSTLTRYVSQKINGCESDRTAIAVRIRSAVTCNPIDSTNINPPPIVNPPPVDTTSNPLPRVQLNYELRQNCGSATYGLHVSGCPVRTQITLNHKTTFISNDFESYIPDNTELYIVCPESISEPLTIFLPGLNPPEINIQTNYHNFVCEGDKTSLGIQLPNGANMIGWEYNGHLFTQQNKLYEVLAPGNYQAVIQRNACTYRSESIYIEMHPKPAQPELISIAKHICVGDSALVRTMDSHPFYLWNGHDANSTFMVLGKQAGNIEVHAQASDDGTCWSNPSKKLSILVYPTPEKPMIVLQKNGGFCPGDSTKLTLNKTGLNYRWSTGETNSKIYSHQPSTYEVAWQDSMACWSLPSTSITTFHFPDEKQPSIHASNRQFCLGEYIIVHTSPAFEYHWSTGAKSDSIIVATSDVIYLKTQNEYGCWSPPSLPIRFIAQENPWMPKLIRSGVYFIVASNQEPITKYEWILNKNRLNDTTAQIKIRQSGLFQVRAIRTYEMADAKPIQCYSPFQVASFGIPADDPGVYVYPNPNKGGKMQIEIQETLQNIEVILSDLQGKEIKQWHLSDSSQIQHIELTDIISGAYLLKIFTEKWSRVRRIFIVSD